MQPTSTLRRTPLHAAQAALGARFVPFGGWDMPVQFTGILDEHRAVRSAAGLFDISHMGQVRVSGPGADAWLDATLTNAVERVQPGGSQYTFLLNDAGGVIDDLILYRLGEEQFFLVINAAVADRDLEWMRSRLTLDGVALEDLGPRGGLALQGPAAPAIFASAFGAAPPMRREILECEWQGRRFLAAGTGYTGEAGCEIFCAASDAAALHARLLDVGTPAGLKPCGLGARDTLRLEMAYPLNGSDLSPERTPVEAGLAMFVSVKKTAFYPGRGTIERQISQGPPSLLAALMLDPGAPPPRAHYPVIASGRRIGELTSGALSPTLGRGIALAYLPPELARPGSEVQIEIRGKSFPAKTVPKPFHQPAP